MAGVYSVAQVNSYIKNMFAQDFLLRRLSVKGEVSNCKYHSSGHIYFTLKDGGGTLQAVMFASQRRGLNFKLAEGQQVVVKGTVDVYERDGKYQLYASEIELSGRGDLYLRFEKLLKDLEEMGMFDPQYKRPIPRFAKTVGIVTAPTGAAIRDIMNISHRRNPYVQLILYPALVQGDGAKDSIVKGIRTLDAMGLDVLIVGRGGGSLEDLWSFNDERVARAIFASRIPVVSAVGHETDVTIADFVADLRAPTPSAAAEVVSRNQQELLRQVQSTRQRLEMAMDYYLANRTRRFTQIHHRLQQQHPQLRLARQQTMLERLQKRMSFALENQLKRTGQQQQRLTQRLNQQNPQPKIHRAQTRIQQLEYRLAETLRAQLSATRERFGNAVTHLEAVSPLSTLARGYSVTTATDGNVLKKVKQVKAGEMLTTRLEDGWIESEVKNIQPVKKSRKKVH